MSQAAELSINDRIKSLSDASNTPLPLARPRQSSASSSGRGPPLTSSTRPSVKDYVARLDAEHQPDLGAQSNLRPNGSLSLSPAESPLSPIPVSSRPSTPPTDRTKTSVHAQNKDNRALRNVSDPPETSENAVPALPPRPSSRIFPTSPPDGPKSLAISSNSLSAPRPLLQIAGSDSLPFNLPSSSISEPNLMSFIPTTAHCGNPSPGPTAAAAGDSNGVPGPPLPSRPTPPFRPTPRRESTDTSVTPRTAPGLPPRPAKHVASRPMQLDVPPESGEVKDQAMTRKRYEALYESLRPKDTQCISNESVARVWARSRLDRAVLRSIWMKCGVQQGNEISCNEFCRGMAMIDEHLA